MGHNGLLRSDDTLLGCREGWIPCNCRHSPIHLSDVSSAVSRRRKSSLDVQIHGTNIVWVARSLGLPLSLEWSQMESEKRARRGPGRISVLRDLENRLGHVQERCGTLFSCAGTINKERP